MEQSRLAAKRFYRAFFLSHNRARKRSFAAASSTGRAADPNIYSKERDCELKPAVPSGESEETKNHYESEPDKREFLEKETEKEYVAGKETEPLTHRRLPYAAALRLESTGVNYPIESFIQQKRENSTVNLEEISCAGLDGTPWPMTEKGTDDKEDNNDYYRHQKASPLSEIKMADTRKPITRATDATADVGQDYGLGRVVIGWLPEQLDTAEEALERASRIWRENAMRGDPDTPHGRILRVLRGEWF